MGIDIRIADDRWSDLSLQNLVERAYAATLLRAGLDEEICALSVLACDDTEIAELNAEFRGKPKPTNVLSWPAEDLAADDDGGVPHPLEPDFTGEIELGDVAISYETCLREAQEAQKPPAAHVSHLIVHGILHLLGYDHERDLDATLMETLEIEILGTMGIDNPYSER